MICTCDGSGKEACISGHAQRMEGEKGATSGGSRQAGSNPPAIHGTQAPATQCASAWQAASEVQLPPACWQALPTQLSLAPQQMPLQGTVPEGVPSQL